MALSLLLLAPLLAQAGPTVAPGAGGALPQAPVVIHRPRRETAGSTHGATGKLAQCLELVDSAPLDALETAQGWGEAAVGIERTEARECEGMALVRLERWGEAVGIFSAAREVAPSNEFLRMARLGGMAGNAALAAGDPATADSLFAAAHADAQAGDNPMLAGDIAADWARALVLLDRAGDAEARLAEARTASPENALGWLLSATLARRQGKLGEAQLQIETAARLNPRNPEVGLEAGVIAVLGGRDAAARRSWQSVIAAAPGTEIAATAQSYLDQLGPEAAPPAQ